MSRILLLGLCPLPFEDTKKSFAPGIRSYQFIKCLINDHHEVLFIGSIIPSTIPDPPPFKEIRTDYGFRYIQMEQSAFQDLKHIRQEMEIFNPDCIIGATIYASYTACLLGSEKPIWSDMFGHVMSEAQAKTFVYKDDSYLKYFWKLVLPVLELSDIFSSVSERQKNATIGELGTRGRLSYLTAGYEFCHTIPAAVMDEELVHQKRVLRGIKASDDDFIILYSGGYNTWMDAETLFYGLEMAMKEDKSIKFVSTGGQIDGHDEKTYPHFQELINLSPMKDNFILEGWLPKSEVANYYFEANVGVNIDSFLYEGYFGSRNRILDWSRAGLPTLTTRLSELSEALADKGLCFTFKIKDPQDLAEKIIWLSSNREMVKETGIKCRDFIIQEYSIEKTTLPLRHWAKNPSHSPDFEQLKSERQRFPESAHYQLEVAQKYINKLEEELRKKEEHINSLERYVRKLEKEIKLLVNQPLLTPLYKVKERLFRKKKVN